MMIPFEKDLIRFFSTRDRNNKKKENIRKQLSYCMLNIDEQMPDLTQEQKDKIHQRWDKYAFAYPVNTQWHQMYTNKTGKFSENYIPNELHYYFLEHKTINYDYLRAFTDKNYLSLLFRDIKQPPVVIRCIQGLFYGENYDPISKQEAAKLIKESLSGGVVVKPSIHSWGGRNIAFLKKEMSLDEIERLFRDYGKNFIAQRVITQHDALAAIHSESVNTIRIITTLLNGEFTILSACLRMGVGKSQVDNFSQGGVGCGVQENGQLRCVGYDRHGNRVDRHPSGFRFEDCTIPDFPRVLDAVKRAAFRVPQFGVASWDFAIDKEGDPVLIEYNVSQGGIDIHQYNNGPLYGEKTEQMLEYIFKNYCMEDTCIFYNYNVFCDHVTVKTGSKQIGSIRIREEHHSIPVTRIGQKAFEAARLRRIRLPKSLRYIDYCAFYKCRKLRKVIMPDGVQHIGRSAFNGCTNLKAIRLPATVKAIETRAFKDVPQLKIWIPEQTTEIADNAFENCDVTICGKKGTFAQEFAQRNNLKFCVKR